MTYKTLLDIRWSWDYAAQDGSYELWIGTETRDYTRSGHLKPRCPACRHWWPPTTFERVLGETCYLCGSVGYVGWGRWLLWHLWTAPKNRLVDAWLHRVWWPLQDRRK